MPAPTPMKGAKPTPEDAAEGEEPAAAPAEAAEGAAEGEAEGEEAAAPPTPVPAPPAAPLDPTAAALQLAELALELEAALQAHDVLEALGSGEREVRERDRPCIRTFTNRLK